METKTDYVKYSDAKPARLANSPVSLWAKTKNYRNASLVFFALTIAAYCLDTYLQNKSKSISALLDALSLLFVIMTFFSCTKGFCADAEETQSSEVSLHVSV